MSSLNTYHTNVPGQHLVRPIPFKARSVERFSAGNHERHCYDRYIYRWRIMETEFRDSFNVGNWVNDIPKTKPVIDCCMYGFWLSQKAAEELRDAGVGIEMRLKKKGEPV